MSNASRSERFERPEFVTLIAVYQFITAAILLLLSCLFSVAAFPALLFTVGDADEVFAIALFGSAALALMIGFGVASVIVGWGLLRMRDWARLGAIILAAFALIGFPIWTIVAILILVYLTSQEARYAFRPEEAPPEIAARTISTDEPDAASQAVYKAEPPPRTEPDLTDETRRVTYTPASESTNGETGDQSAPEETRDVTGPIEMPADESLEDTEQAASSKEVAAPDEYDDTEEQYGDPSRADDLTEEEEEETEAEKVWEPPESEQPSSTQSEESEAADEEGEESPDDEKRE